MSIIVPSCPKDREEIRKVIKELSNSMVRAEAEKDYQKEAIKAVAEQFDIEAKYIRTMARDYHKNLYKKKVDEMSEYELLYENIMSPSKLDDSDSED